MVPIEPFLKKAKKWILSTKKSISNNIVTMRGSEILPVKNTVSVNYKRFSTTKLNCSRVETMNRLLLQERSVAIYVTFSVFFVVLVWCKVYPSKHPKQQRTKRKRGDVFAMFISHDVNKTREVQKLDTGQWKPFSISRWTINSTRSFSREVKLYSLSNHKTSLCILPAEKAPRTSNIDEWVRDIRSLETSCSSVTPRIPLNLPSAAFFTVWKIWIFLSPWCYIIENIIETTLASIYDNYETYSNSTTIST